MTWIVMAMVLTVAALLQTLLPSYAFMGQSKAPFLLAVVVYYALNRDAVLCLVAGLFAGFVQDVLSGMPLGYSSCCFGILGLAAAQFRGVLNRESVGPAAILGMVAAICEILVMGAVLSKRDFVSCSPGWCLLKAFWTGVLGLWSASLMFLLARRLDRMAGNVLVKENVTGIE